MQRTFGHLALSHRPFFVPRGFWLSFKDYDGEPTNVREHQDAYEFFTRLQVRSRCVAAHSLCLPMAVGRGDTISICMRNAVLAALASSRM